MSTGTDGSRVVDVAMPRLSDSMEEATVLQWLKRPGERLAKGEPLVEVETDKATVVYEAELDGIVTEILVAEGESAALGAVIARLRVEGGTAVPRTQPPLRSQPAQAASPAESPRPRGRAGERQRATPVARRLAAELGVSLARIPGTGPGGRIVRADVRVAAGNGTSSPSPSSRADGRGAVTEIALTPTQRTIARRMSESRAAIPDFTLQAEIDMDPAHGLRTDLREAGHDPLPSFNDLVVRAVALALREFPALNASYDDGRVLRFERINVGVAVATDDALLVPTIFDADRKSVFAIAAESLRLVDRVRARSIGVDELADGTFTVSNLGMFGVRRFDAVISHPQAAILAVGEVASRAVVAADGAIVARRLMDVSLSCDHRVVYGAEAARFLQRLRNLLEHPVELAVERATRGAEG